MKHLHFIYISIIIGLIVGGCSCSDNNDEKATDISSQQMLQELLTSCDNDYEAIAHIFDDVTPSTIKRIERGETYPTESFEKEIRERYNYAKKYEMNFPELRSNYDKDYRWYNYIVDNIWVLITLFILVEALEASTGVMQKTRILTTIITACIVLNACSVDMSWNITYEGDYICNENKDTLLAYSWSGGNVNGLIDGFGPLTITQKDGTKETINTFACFGFVPSRSSQDFDKITFWGKNDGDDPNGLGVYKTQIDDELCYCIGYFVEDFCSNDSVRCYNSYRKLIYKGFFEDGQPNGQGELYYANGILKAHGNFEDGRLNGEGTLYYDNGRIKYSGQLSDGQFDGAGTFYTLTGEPQNHVWDKGEVSEDTKSKYSLVEKNKDSIPANEYESILNYFYFCERYGIWLKTLLILAVGIVCFFCYKMFVKSKKQRYFRAKPMTAIEYLLLWLGSPIGLLHARRNSWVTFPMCILLCLCVILNLDTIIFFAPYPSMWSDLYTDDVTVFRIYIYATCVIALIDILIMPYILWLDKNKYYRIDYYEKDILGNGTSEIESFYNKLSADIRESNHVMEHSGRNSSDDISTFYEAKRHLEELIRQTKEMEKASLKIAQFVDPLNEYMKCARQSAYKNISLAKELIYMIKKTNVKSQTQELYIDENIVFNEVAVPHIKIEEIGEQYQKQFQRDMERATNHFFDGIFGGHGFWGGIGMAGLALLEAAAANYEYETKMWPKITKATVRVSASKAELYASYFNAEAQMVRASELLTALFFANKAFVNAYAPIRDKVFGKPTFRSFINHLFGRYEYLDSIECKKDIQHLIAVCSEYNKINQTHLK